MTPERGKMCRDLMGRCGRRISAIISDQEATASDQRPEISDKEPTARGMPNRGPPGGGVQLREGFGVK
jgi:hypothetical protein